ncbi:hypothetical protein VDGE_30417 [Verticillium dahliae]|uniref:Uncharacterized protein n=1 Tax=Verticillium dahliae TaxID=27337 RepID=A0A444S730_VERDA|nr:hypothetical protein VDGE_30417 [Verticillium dahliae]
MFVCRGAWRNAILDGVICDRLNNKADNRSLASTASHFTRTRFLETSILHPRSPDECRPFAEDLLTQVLPGDGVKCPALSHGTIEPEATSFPALPHV